MVDKSDYKLISIFEVFAINRSEDDFLENLGLFNQYMQEQEEDKKKVEEENADPRIKVLNT